MRFIYVQDAGTANKLLQMGFLLLCGGGPMSWVFENNQPETDLSSYSLCYSDTLSYVK